MVASLSFPGYFYFFLNLERQGSSQSHSPCGRVMKCPGCLSVSLRSGNLERATRPGLGEESLGCGYRRLGLDRRTLKGKEFGLETWGDFNHDRPCNLRLGVSHL